MTHFFVFDIESIGLHGEGFAYGYVIIDRRGHHLQKGCLAANPAHARGTDEDRLWVAEHVLPHLTCLPGLTPRELRDSFWDVWNDAKRNYPGILMCADVPWPVEARFLNQCVDDAPARNWEGPYPLIDVNVARFTAGMADAKAVRFPSELPEHHPLMDAIQSARLLVEALDQHGDLMACDWRSFQ